ncbi:tungstate ABC transporter substrate-binding protein WtpA [Moorellaceae bacterium AZ2]
MRVRGIVAAAVALTLLVTSAACGLRKAERVRLKVIYAGSLIVPLEEVELQFESLHPDVDVEMEGHGSIQVIRYVTDLGKQADVLAVADYTLIPAMMYPDYADWLIRFASNRLVLAYTEKSRYASEINSFNWYEIISRPDVKIGLAHPLLDASGYRALMAVQLAEIYYQDPTIFDRAITEHFNPAILVREDKGTYTIELPEVIKPRGERFSLRGGSIQLMALLEAGAIDYAFEYRSVALQHGFKFIELPPQVNLGFPDQEELYEKVKVEFGFRRFAAVEGEQVGKTIYYALTVPRNAPHRSWAEEYIRFILGPEGEKIFEKHHHPFVPAVTDNPTAIPLGIAPLVRKEEGHPVQ